MTTLNESERSDFYDAAFMNFARMAEAERLLQLALEEMANRRELAGRVHANCDWTLANYPDVARALFHEWQSSSPSAMEAATTCLRAQVVV